jgi:tetratricopeptide (TPR) repeat protein
MNKSAIRSFGRRGRAYGRSFGMILRLAIVLLVTGAAALGYLFLTRDQAKVSDGAAPPPASARKEVLATWNSGDTEGTLSMTRASLESRPLDSFYLSMNGIAAYYLSSSKTEGDERQALLDESVFSLRKALAAGDSLPVKAQVEYVLGKAYFQKGSPWFDLAADYLSRAKGHGYKAKDMEHYLALSFAGQERHAEAAAHFETAIGQLSSDVLMLSAAISYKELGDVNRSAELLAKAIEVSGDGLVIQRARSMLGEFAIARNDWPEARKLFQAVVEADPRSAEGWYSLGLVSEALGDPIRARSEWRKATSIDPNHIEARRKLADRL